MTDDERKALEDAGYVFEDAEVFLGFTEEEIEMFERHYKHQNNIEAVESLILADQPTLCRRGYGDDTVITFRFQDPEVADKFLEAVIQWIGDLIKDRKETI